MTFFFFEFLASLRGKVTGLQKIKFFKDLFKTNRVWNEVDLEKLLKESGKVNSKC